MNTSTTTDPAALYDAHVLRITTVPRSLSCGA